MSDIDDAEDWLPDIDAPSVPPRRKTLAQTMGNEIQVAAHELLDRVKALLEEGRVRRLRVKSPGGELYFEIPVTLGAIGGAALAMAAPFLAMAGGLASLGNNDFRLEIERDGEAAAMMDSGARALADLGTGLATAAKNLSDTVRGRVGRTTSGGKARGGTGKRGAARKGRTAASRAAKTATGGGRGSAKRAAGGKGRGAMPGGRRPAAGPATRKGPKKPGRGKPKGR
jgi:hypothetical protein